MRRIIKPLATIAATALLSLAAISTAHAANLDGNGALTGTDGNTPPVAITKLLQVPTGTALPPDGYFEFFVMPVSVDGDTGAASEAPPLGTNPAGAEHPPMGLEMISVKADSLTQVTVDPAQPGIDTYEIETAIPLATADFPHPGVYVYDIKEAGYVDDGTDQFTQSVLTPDQTMKFSQADYIMTVYVESNSTETANFVSAVTVVQTANDDGTPTATPDEDGTTNYPKVDPTPGGDQTTYLYSQLAFTNQYVHTNSTTDPTENPPLAISKTVTGSMANKATLFSFTVTLDDPSGLVTDPAAMPAYYRAYVVDNGVIIDPTPYADAAIIDTDGTNSFIEVSTSAPTDFELKDGQSLVFVDTPVGTGYSVTENDPTGYLPSYLVTTNGIEPRDPTAGTISVSLGTGDQLVGEDANEAAFTNDRSLLVTTGLTMDNLPYVGLIAVLVLAVVGYATVKVRLRNREA